MVVGWGWVNRGGSDFKILVIAWRTGKMTEMMREIERMNMETEMKVEPSEMINFNKFSYFVNFFIFFY